MRDDEQLKIELLSQWKLEAEFRNLRKIIQLNILTLQYKDALEEFIEKTSLEVTQPRVS